MYSLADASTPATAVNLRIATRAGGLIAVALAGWSLNVRWGTNAAVRGGPPLQWEKEVVGAAVLTALAALALWLGTRPTASATRHWLRAVAAAAAAGTAAIAIHLRRDAERPGLADLVNGPGWSWLAAGAALALVAAGVSFAIRAPAAPSRKRRRGG